MDPARNPYAPGAGLRPPEFAGRDDLLRDVNIAVTRSLNGRATQNLIMVGLRGVGKTVLLNRMRREAEQAGAMTLRIEAPEDRSLPAMLAPELKSMLLKLSLQERAREHAQRALGWLAGFVKAFKAKYEDIEFSLDLAPQQGADNGDLEYDLPALIEVVAEAAQRADSAVGIFVDEMQYIAESQLAALITALHRAAQQELPVLLVGAGLPQLRANAGKAKSYSERLLLFRDVGELSVDAAKQALTVPAREEGVEYESEAIDEILRHTHCYPYFLQEWGKHTWDVATHSPILLSDVQAATPITIAGLDKSFFMVRFDRLTPAEKRYVRAMAELGAGPHRSGDIATMLDKRVESLGPVRNRVISKGMVWSPAHGDTAFTVPLFDEFMRRIMPNDDWRDM